MAEKNKERLKEITDSIEQGIQNLFQSDRYAQYLRTMSRFHRYSVNNTMLIYMQKPGATLVAGFNKWRDQFSRNVMRGEKGIKIIAPTPFKKKIEEEKLDPDTKIPMRDADGNIIMEEKEIKIPMYKVVSVFDVSQTEGKPLPTLVNGLTGNVKQYEIFMEALRRSSPVPLAFETMELNTDGYFSEKGQRIAIRSGMSEVQTVSAAVHEITHATLHNYEQARLAAAKSDETAEPPKPKDRHTEEVEAESVSYAVCQYYGIQTGENSFGYIATWSRGKELPELRASLETINKTASGLISDIDQNFREVLKEYDTVLEQFAGDVYQYTASVMEPPFPLNSMEEEVPATVEDLKSGYGKDTRNAILNAAKVAAAASPDELLRRLDEIEKIYPWRETEAMYLLDNAAYLYLKENEDGYGYILYDKESLRETANGFADEGVSSIPTAYEQALALEHLTPAASEKVSLDILSKITAVREQDVQEYIRKNNLGDHEPDAPKAQTAPDQPKVAGMLPDAPEQALDEYPMPDSELTVADLEACGYLDGDLLPLSKDRALELFEQDLTVYMIEDGSASMAFDPDEIQAHSGLFAVSREEWEESRKFSSAIEDRMKHQEQREAAFLKTSQDAFAIYQVKSGDELRDIRFEPLSWLESKGVSVDHGNYDLAYTAPLADQGSTDDRLSVLWDRFNNEHSTDYHRPSLSVSDIVALKQNGVVSCHYVDSFGFQEIPAFLKPENYLKNAEMAVEDDYDMIDGIIDNGKNPTVAELEQQAKTGQPISLLELAEASRRENDEKKKSVVERLRNQPVSREHKKAAPDRGAEMER
ncbi:MAG: YodL domain-containing protein [Oscillospiraceae bacterium]|jgi:antirestriction protein ArdC|nr:YodL domain-containing protein [Oscillospiraceae bacterium]